MKLFSGFFSKEKSLPFNYLGPSGKFQGKIVFEGELRIDGSFEGEICSRNASLGKEKVANLPSNIYIGKDANIKGNISADIINVWGKAEGVLKAHRKLIIHPFGEVKANLFTPKLIIQEGAKFSGSNLESEGFLEEIIISNEKVIDENLFNPLHQNEQITNY